jgi:Flp pilus assembly pilin Flp
MTAALSALVRDETAATALEYAFLMALVALAIVGSVTLVGNEVAALFGLTATEVRDAVP